MLQACICQEKNLVSHAAFLPKMIDSAATLGLLSSRIMCGEG
jgi:hypothetical protein